VDVDGLLTALNRLHPRALQVLFARFVAETAPGSSISSAPAFASVLSARFVAETASGAGRDQASFAKFYGIELPAADLLLFRASIAFEAALEGAPPPPARDFDDERRAAAEFIAALESPTPPTSQRLGRLVDALRALTTHAAILRDRLAAAERAELESPGYARETWLRRIAIVLVLALSGWFYLKDDLVRRWRQWTTDVTQPAPPR
jgi:hypothetical protein